MKTVFNLLVLSIVFYSVTIMSQTELKQGSTAPGFTLQDAYGNEYTLSSYLGKSPVVIYFYPKAGTAGCTKQACGIRDDKDKYEKNNIRVFGISTDSKEEIKKFIDDYDLNFPLLSDADKTVSKKYGVLSTKGFAKRVSFVIDKEGKIAGILEVKDIESHSDYIFNAAMKLNNAEN